MGSALRTFERVYLDVTAFLEVEAQHCLIGFYALYCKIALLGVYVAKFGLELECVGHSVVTRFSAVLELVLAVEENNVVALLVLVVLQ